MRPAADHVLSPGDGFQLTVMQSNGGLTPVEVATEKPM